VPSILYLCARPQQSAADAEYASFRVGMRLDESDLHRHDLVREPLPEDAFDRYAGFVVGGSPFNLTDPESTKTEAQRRLEADLSHVAAEAAASRTAAMFTCYGIGIVTRMLGGTVSRAFPEDTGPTTVSLTPGGREDELFGALEPTFTALTAHKEGTEALPGGAELLAENDGCPVQAYRVGDRLYATQFHPEPTTRDFTERMAVYRNDGYFDAGDFDAVAARVLAASVTQPARLLAAFASRFAA
jgi:GMP synthase (glutamine-hydrolysing)